MEEWKSYKMGDLFTLEYGKPVEDKDSIDGPIPVFGTNGQIGTSHLAPLCNHPSVILGRKGAYRGVHFSDRPFSVIDTAFYVEPISDVFDIKWLYYKLLTYDINSMDSGSAIPSTDRYQIYSLSIDLPSLEVQKRTVRVLDSINDKIALNNRINHNLEQQAQALYKSWFVDFEPFKDGKFVESELGMIPEGWSIATIESLSSRIASGGTPRSLDSSYYEGNIKWFTTKELKDCFLFDSEKHISDTAVQNSAAKFFPTGSVLMAIYASPTVGRLGILTEPSTFNQAAVAIIPQDNIGTEYVYMTLLSERDNLNNLASGAAQQNLNVGIVKNYQVIRPTDEIIMSFKTTAGPIFSAIRNNSKEIHALSALRDSLIPQLMSGLITY